MSLLTKTAVKTEPGQRERAGGKLIVESLAHITQLENEMRYLVAVIDANLECGNDPRVKYAKTLLSPNASSQSDALDSDCEQIILECVPGGDVCDPQTVADNIREYFKKRLAAMPNAKSCGGGE